MSEGSCFPVMGSKSVRGRVQPQVGVDDRRGRILAHARRSHVMRGVLVDRPGFRRVDLGLEAPEPRPVELFGEHAVQLDE